LKFTRSTCNRAQADFSLIELLVVIAIIGILTLGLTMAIPSLSYAQIFFGLCPARGGTAVTGASDSPALSLDGGTGHVVIDRS